MQKANYITALKVSLVVGTVLNLINNSDAIFSCNCTIKLTLKMLFTYLVPFFVSLYSANMSIKQNKK